ncbi:Nonribosomal peptide synthetase 8 [Bienertia sinuspersici]
MVKTRSSKHRLLYCDQEIERTLRRMRKEQRKIQVDLEFDLEKLFKEEMARVCGICSDLSHTIDSCPIFKTEDVNALCGFPGQPQRKYDPFSSTYNEGWHDHPNLRYGPKQPFPQATNPRPYVPQNFQPLPSSSSSFEGMVKNLATQIGNIDTRIGRICTSLSSLKSQFLGKLPSKPHPNPKEQVNRIMIMESQEVNELEEPEVISEELSNTIKLLDAINFDSLHSTYHTLAVADNTEVKIVGTLNNALIHVKNLFFLDDFYVVDIKQESTILLGRRFLKTSKALIDVADDSVLMESNGEKIEFNMIEKSSFLRQILLTMLLIILSRFELTIWKQYLMEWLPTFV